MKNTVLLTLVFLYSFLFGKQPIFGGFIKFDMYYNTRQIVSAREGHYYLYPQPIDEKDLNSDPFFNMANFQSRVWLKINGKKAYGAEVSGKIEADFFGTGNGLENVLRLRHAFIKMSWPKIDVLFGQYWSPLFTLDVFPQVVNFNTGAPFQPFARFPQISIKWKIAESLSVLGAATMQRDAFQEISGREVQQRSGIPAIHLQGIWKQGTFLFGTGGYWKALRPEKGGENIYADALTIFSKLGFNNLNIRMKYISGNDLSDHIMLGGYAIIENTETGIIDFRPTNLNSYWLDAEYAFNKLLIGIFTGFTENYGMKTELEPDDVYTFKARSSNILTVFRISPRIVWKRNNLKFALELDRTDALYTSAYADNLKPEKSEDDKPVVNDRLLFAVYLSF